MLTKLEILCKTYGLFTLHPHLLSISVLSKKLASGPSVSFSHRRLLRVPLDSKEIKPVNPKGNQPWIFIVRTDAEVEAPILWPPDVKSWLTGKDPDAGKDWRQEEKGSTEDEMVAWHHWLSGHEFSKFWELVKDREAWCPSGHGVAKVGDNRGDRTTIILDEHRQKKSSAKY